MIAASVVGLTLTELAVGLGVARERARLLVEPFLAAGIVEERRTACSSSRIRSSWRRSRTGRSAHDRAPSDCPRAG